MFPLMKTFAIIGILLINFYSTKNYLVEVGDERSEEYDLEERSEEDLMEVLVRSLWEDFQIEEHPSQTQQH